jgi:hypothetical protein
MIFYPYRTSILLSSLMVWALVVGAGCRLADDPSKDAVWNLSSRAASQGTEHFASASSNPAEFFFGIMYEDVRGTVTLTVNGFPIHQAGGGRRFQNGILSYSLQSALVSGQNIFRIEIEPTTLRHGDALWFPTVRLHGRVTGDYHGDQPIPGAAITEAQVDSAYAKWKKRAEAAWARFLRSEAAWLEANPDRGWEITWRSGGALDSMWAWSRDHPVVVSTTFENEAGPDYAYIFRDAPVLQDTARVLSFALQIRDLFRKRDTEKIYAAHRPVFAEFNRSPDEAQEVIATNWLGYEWNLDFDAGDLEIVPWSNGRVWEVYRIDEGAERLGEKALLLAGEERIKTWHSVYIAEIDGELQVVR